MARQRHHANEEKERSGKETTTQIIECSLFLKKTTELMEDRGT